MSLAAAGPESGLTIPSVSSWYHKKLSPKVSILHANGQSRGIVIGMEPDIGTTSNGSRTGVGIRGVSEGLLVHISQI